MKTLDIAVRSLLLAAIMGWSMAVFAQAALRDEIDLIETLKRQPPCCVIDARSDARRQQHALADALTYRPGLSIVPSATVIVVGDDNESALKVAESLAKQHPSKSIFAVRGGVTAWEFVRKALDKVSASSSGAPPAGVSFVIPKNTCESGTTLQILSSKPKAKP
ncbi:MAG: hypothetical protein KJ614_14920 [Gammaproteobacteria bacterium]|uniref:hypothetical protein n=1 Tax=Rhodoferax sp. TaxID=50421 RepID=UPI0017D3F284|nr:hypothetical protein [Rhodoferax sp.]MBU3900190.1 hypothetical protein [Gammaproteobacteria bacterium]MBA3057482.1 hypothetical protein [Rhodoferax sp.]MBU3999514.1 hypothetical protein [Gammaproteobacteria bacterium]MBU4082254.1 hypothetical protein [Gammaproteobacteria bacterium]MBU4112352.1 hypothetical protein [Gammaproteobacteria bacterium]